MHIPTLLTLFLIGTIAVIAQPTRARADDAKEETAVATFAGGCFWCMEKPYDELDGIISTTSGYAGGNEDNPTYKQVSSGRTGHYEAIQIVYDPTKVDYTTLLDVFWRNVDPLDPHGQFCDKGKQYRTAIFAHDAEQRRQAEKSRAALDESGVLPAPIVTEILDAKTFWPAESYHQDYYITNPIRYKFYRYNCGRDKRLKELWGTK